MKSAFRKALRVYLYLLLAYTLFFWIFMIVDDFDLVSRHWSENWPAYLLGWFIWHLIYGLGLSLYYWGIVPVLIFIHRRLFRTSFGKNQYL